LACFSADLSAGLPPATNVLQRVIERAAQVSRGEKNQKYSYSKRSLTEELNSRGEPTHSTEKLYRVELIRGWPFERLVQIQGHELSEEELEKENQREEKFRNRIAGKDLKQRRDRKEAWITPELLARYHFSVISNDVCQNRKALVLAFKPKPNNPETTVEDKLFNRFAGLLWIDNEDAEIAKLDVHLTEDISLGWVGMLGSLKECHLTLQRQRMPEGTWVNSKHTLSIIGRKLLSTMRIRSSEESSGFHTGS
jgi:hypothetical protein